MWILSRSGRMLSYFPVLTSMPAPSQACRWRHSASSATTASGSWQPASGGRPRLRTSVLGLRRRRGLRHSCLRRLDFRRRLLHERFYLLAYECREWRCESLLRPCGGHRGGFSQKGFWAKLERNTFQCFSESKVAKVVGLGVRAQINLEKGFYITIKNTFL